MTFIVFFFQNGNNNNDNKALISIKMLLFLETMPLLVLIFQLPGSVFVYNKCLCQDDVFTLKTPRSCSSLCHAKYWNGMEWKMFYNKQLN